MADFHGNANFRTTQWSAVLSIQENHAGAKEALEGLCYDYWFPIYAFIRRRGYGPEEAQDLTQDFFVELSKNDLLAHVHPQHGRFRSYLLACLNYLLVDHWRKENAEKRGGDQTIVSIDDAAESDYQAEIVDNLTPAQVFDRCLVSRILERVRFQLREECAAAGKSDLFDLVEPRLRGQAEWGDYEVIASKLGLTEVALRVAVHRLRQRFARILRQEMARLVSDPAMVDEELDCLLSICSD